MKFFNVIILFFFITGCNLLSIENISNDFKYKKDRFNKTEILKYRFKPFIVNKIGDRLFFYDIMDSQALDSHYKVQSLLHEKCNKRNIKLETSDRFSLSIDTLYFEEHENSSTPIYCSENETTIYGNEYCFKFMITGTIKVQDSLISIKVVKEYTSEPRESFVFPNVVVNSGINTSAKKMIENSIAKFSYRVFKTLEGQDSK